MRKLLAILFALSLVAAACGDDDGGDDGGDESQTTTSAADDGEDDGGDDGDEGGNGDGGEDAAGDGELTNLRVTSLNLCNEIAVFWALEKGIFEDHGIDVELVRSTGGSAGLAALMGDSADLAFVNTLSAILAYEQGFPIRYVATLYHSPVAPNPEVNQLVVSADSDIEGPEDLVGTRIGVNELGGVNQLVTSNYLRKHGVDPSEVNFVALPFPELAPAVVSGRLDAAQVPVSLASRAGDDVRNIADPFREGPGELVFAGYLATEEFHEENQPALEAFQDALSESLEDFRDDPERFDVMAEYCPTPVEALRELPETGYFIEVDMELFQKSAEILVEEGQLPEMPDWEGLVPEWARVSSS